MLHILLIILKTIGIILISILVFLLILTLIVLFVPIRYQIEARKYEDIQGYVKIRWLLSILYFHLRYEKEKVKFQFRIFGFIIKDSDKPKKLKIKNKSNNIKKSNRKHSKKIKLKKHMNGKQNNITKSEENENAYIKENSQNERLGTKGNEHKEEVKSFQRNITQNESTGKNDINDNQKIPNLENKKVSLWEKLRNRICNIYKKIKEFFVKICIFIKKVKFKLIELNMTRDNIVHRFNLIKSFLKDDINKKGIKKIWISIKKISKHILPKRIKGNIHFGTGDPCSTGQVLGAISLTYHHYQKGVRIIPDFNEEILEGYVNAKGRIRLFTLAIICIKLLLNENFKQLLKRYQELKEEL